MFDFNRSVLHVISSATTHTALLSPFFPGIGNTSKPYYMYRSQALVTQLTDSSESVATSTCVGVAIKPMSGIFGNKTATRMLQRLAKVRKE